MSGAVEEADLEALQEGISCVLATEAHRLRLHEHIDGKIALDRILWDNAVELGWPAIGLPEEFGGLGFGPLGLSALHRQLGRAVAPGPFMASLSGAQALCDIAGPAIQAEWLPRLAVGECSIAVAAQPGCALSRNEIWLLGAPDAEAALVPMRDGDWALIALEGAAPVAVWDHTRTMLSVNLSTAKPIAQLPGEATPRSLSRHLSLAIASDSIAGARAIAEQTVAYMKERQQFGRSIASFQALKHRVADLMTMIVSGEEFVSLATEAAAAGHADADIWANLAKVRATETYVQVSSDCLQLHGGVGFTWEFDVHLYLNRARLSEMLVAPNAALRDAAAEGFAAAFRAGQQPLELAL